MKRILVILPNWFGDTLFATPVLAALKQHDPDSRVATLGVARAQEILLGNPAVDERIQIEDPASAPWRGWRLFRRVRESRFDVGLVLRRSLSRTALLAMAGVPRRIGLANSKSGWLLTDRVPAPPHPSHRAADYLALLAPLGIDVRPWLASPPSYRYYPTQEDRTQAGELLRAHGLGVEDAFIVLHPGANWPHKRWPAARFGELAGSLQAATGLAVVLTGTAVDEPLLRAIAGAMRRMPVMLAGRTTLRQAAAVLERARLVVSNDTGMLHLACAMDRPVVALYGPTSPAITGPLGAPERTIVIHHPDCCPAVPCYQPDHPAHPGMASISVEEVHDATMKLLAGAEKGRSLPAAQTGNDQ
ncbi:MAG: lipopolysaccharide heptosyltransferase II [Candidatus Omnitrophica bacterium]|nr:lipopolysaccharide heptosyltransferase II [Candidatus Omnitrophota bacterium]